MGKICFHDIVGKVHVLTGSMWTRKTDELISFARDLEHAGVGHVAVNSSVNGRDIEHGEVIMSRAGDMITAKVLDRASEIPKYISNVEKSRRERVSAVIVEEGNFWDRELSAVLMGIARRGRAVLVAGLDKDFRGNPFGPMEDLIQFAGPENVDVYTGYCMFEYRERPCGKKSRYTGRFLSDSRGELSVYREGRRFNGLVRAPYFDPTIRDGDEPYAILCEKHFEVPYRDEVLEVADYIDKNPGTKRESLERRFSNVGNIDKILNFLINDQVARTVIETEEGRLFTRFD